MGLKRFFVGFITVSLMITSLGGCMVQSEPAVIQLVPEGVSFLGQVQVSKIINDQELRNAYDRATNENNDLPTVDEVLNSAVEQLGLDLRNFSQAIIFGDVKQFSNFGLIAEGTFDETKFISSMVEEKSRVKTPTGDYLEGKFTTTEYKGYKLHTTTGDQKSSIAVAFLSNKVLLYGSTKAVQDIIDVRKGDRKSVSGVIHDTYNKLGDSMVRFAFKIPETARQSLAKELVPGISISSRAFANMDMLGLAFNKETANVTVKMLAHFLDASSVQEARDTLDSAITLFRGLLTVPEVKNLLGKIQLTAQDTWVEMSLDTTVSELEKLVETFRPIPTPVPPPHPTHSPLPAPTPSISYSEPPRMTIDTSKQYTATIETEKGIIGLELFAIDVPVAVNNFVLLAREGFYDNTTFHRVIPDFMAQGGDPTGTGTGGPGYKFADEFTQHTHVTGALSMANSGPDTNGSQFFITYTAQHHLDGKHSVFGQLVSGMDVLRAITQGDKILRITIEES